MTQRLLFVYGTLHPDRAPRELADDVKRFAPIGPGTIQGELREIGGYPATLVGERFQGSVPGVVFELPDDPALLKRLDDYEGFYPDDPASSLYVRVQVPVALPDGQHRSCWAYIYNQRVPDEPARAIRV